MRVGLLQRREEGRRVKKKAGKDEEKLAGRNVGNYEHAGRFTRDSQGKNLIL